MGHFNILTKKDKFPTNARVGIGESLFPGGGGGGGGAGVCVGGGGCYSGILVTGWMRPNL